RSAAYRAARVWLMNSTLLGLVGFTLIPTCPPRLLDASHGFVDTMAQYSAYGWWGAGASAPRGLSGMTNQYAAMPSLHVGWSLWCGVLLWRHARHPLLRWAGIAYPLITTIVVMGTA
ncbi:phosphatase PAP2 family protein, partial [Streptomyces sp. SID8455]|nr:phosphatase PAP2 family protein [Streptomyces sp. SID8455]